VIKEYTDPDRGTINIGFPTSLSSYILPKAISHFRKKYPDVNFELHQGSYNSLVQSVIKGDINIAILGPLPPTHKKLKSMTLFTEEIVALLPTTHRLARRSSISLQELREEAFVMFPEGYV